MVTTPIATFKLLTKSIICLIQKKELIPKLLFYITISNNKINIKDTYNVKNLTRYLLF